MFEDDLPAQKRRQTLALEALSIDDLKARIEALKDEIAQCEALITKKEKVRAAADTLFGSSGG